MLPNPTWPSAYFARSFHASFYATRHLRLYVSGGVDRYPTHSNRKAQPNFRGVECIADAPKAAIGGS